MLPISTSSTGVDSYLNWVREALENTKYGEVGIRFIVHQGQITRVCKTLEVPEKIGVPVHLTLKIGEVNGD